MQKHPPCIIICYSENVACRISTATHVKDINCNGYIMVTLNLITNDDLSNIISRKVIEENVKTPEKKMQGIDDNSK